MKTLELNQMEKVQGGSWACAAGVAGAIGGAAGVALAIPTGGLSLVAAGAFMLAADFTVFASC